MRSFFSVSITRSYNSCAGRPWAVIFLFTLCGSDQSWRLSRDYGWLGYNKMFEDPAPSGVLARIRSAPNPKPEKAKNSDCRHSACASSDAIPQLMPALCAGFCRAGRGPRQRLSGWSRNHSRSLSPDRHSPANRLHRVPRMPLDGRMKSRGRAS